MEWEKRRIGAVRWSNKTAWNGKKRRIDAVRSDQTAWNGEERIDAVRRSIRARNEKKRRIDAVRRWIRLHGIEKKRRIDAVRRCDQTAWNRGERDESVQSDGRTDGMEWEEEKNRCSQKVEQTAWNGKKRRIDAVRMSG